MRKAGWVGLFFALSVGGVSAQEKVLETFEVGNSAYVRALKVEESAKSLWVGTSVGVHEVELATGKLKQTFTREQGLANEYVFAVGIDSQGYKWFGTNAGGVSRYKDGKWKTYFPMHGLADYWVYAFANDKAGNLWIGTWAGANKFDVGSAKFTKTFVKELVNEWVYGIDVDQQGRVWFGTEGGVSLYDGKKWKHWTHADGLGGPNLNNLSPSKNTGLGTRSRHDLSTLTTGRPTYNPSYVFSVMVEDGSVWAGTWGAGVGRFNGKSWQNYTSREGLAGNIVYAITKDKKGVYWFGTDAGVSKFDGRTWKTFSKRDGLLEDHVYALAVAPTGDIWAGTRRGVARIGTGK